MDIDPADRLILGCVRCGQLRPMTTELLTDMLNDGWTFTYTNGWICRLCTHNVEGDKILPGSHTHVSRRAGRPLRRWEDGPALKK